MAGPGVQQVCVFRLQPGLLGSLRTLDLLAQKTSTRLLHDFFTLLLSSVPSDDINEKLEERLRARKLASACQRLRQEAASCVFPREQSQVCLSGVGVAVLGAEL